MNPAAAIQGRNVDAIATWEPYQTDILAKLGSSAVLIQRGGGLLGYILGLETTDEYAKTHGDIVQKMTDALAETEAWIRGHLKEAATIATHYIPGLDADVGAEAIKNLNFDPRVSDCTATAASTNVRCQKASSVYGVADSVRSMCSISGRISAERHPTLPSFAHAS